MTLTQTVFSVVGYFGSDFALARTAPTTEVLSVSRPRLLSLLL